MIVTKQLLQQMIDEEFNRAVNARKKLAESSNAQADLFDAMRDLLDELGEDRAYDLIDRTWGDVIEANERGTLSDDVDLGRNSL